MLDPADVLFCQPFAPPGGTLLEIERRRRRGRLLGRSRSGSPPLPGQLMEKHAPAETTVCTRGASECLIRGFEIVLKEGIDGTSLIDPRLVERAAGGDAWIVEPQRKEAAIIGHQRRGKDDPGGEGEVLDIVHAGRSFYEDRLELVENFLRMFVDEPQIRVIRRGPHQRAPGLSRSQPRRSLGDLLASGIGPSDLNGDAGRNGARTRINVPGVL